jgi:hypothetical protein
LPTSFVQRRSCERDRLCENSHSPRIVSDPAASGGGMKYIQGVDRGQIQLLPPSVEEYVAENAAVRVIAAFVDTLNMEALGFQRASCRRAQARQSLTPHR